MTSRGRRGSGSTGASHSEEGSARGARRLAEADSQLKSANPNPRALMEFLIARLTSPARPNEDPQVRSDVQRKKIEKNRASRQYGTPVKTICRDDYFFALQRVDRQRQSRFVAVGGIFGKRALADRLVELGKCRRCQFLHRSHIPGRESGAHTADGRANARAIHAIDCRAPPSGGYSSVPISSSSCALPDYPEPFIAPSCFISNQREYPTRALLSICPPMCRELACSDFPRRVRRHAHRQLCIDT